MELNLDVLLSEPTVFTRSKRKIALSSEGGVQRKFGQVLNGNTLPAATKRLKSNSKPKLTSILNENVLDKEIVTKENAILDTVKDSQFTVEVKKITISKVKTIELYQTHSIDNLLLLYAYLG